MAAKDKPRRCGNCAFGGFTLGKHGRPLNRCGDCLAPVPGRPVISSAYALPWPPHKTHIWPEDGADCPTYEVKL